MLGSVPYPSLGVAPLVWATPTLPLLQVTSTYLLYLSIVSTNISTNLTNLSTNLHVVSRAIQIYKSAQYLHSYISVSPGRPPSLAGLVPPVAAAAVPGKPAGTHPHAGTR